jgi:hypothetical protein
LIRSRGLIKASLVEDIKPNKSDGGHRPGTPAHEKLTGTIRKGRMLCLYTCRVKASALVDRSRRETASCCVRQKTGVDVWCPIVPELEAERRMRERRPVPPHGVQLQIHNGCGVCEGICGAAGSDIRVI